MVPKVIPLGMEFKLTSQLFDQKSWPRTSGPHNMSRSILLFPLQIYYSMSLVSL